jgi:hypothetical protein
MNDHTIAWDIENHRIGCTHCNKWYINEVYEIKDNILDYICRKLLENHLKDIDGNQPLEKLTQ